MFTVLIFGQIHCHKKYNVYSPRTFSVILQGHFRSSLFSHVNNPPGTLLKGRTVSHGMSPASGSEGPWFKPQ